MLALLASSIVGLGLSGDIGSSYDYLGVGLDLRIWHVAASVALGVSGVHLLDPGSSYSYGLRNVQIALRWGFGLSAVTPRASPPENLLRRAPGTATRPCSSTGPQ
jgi:hypothetical protein